MAKNIKQNFPKFSFQKINKSQKEQIISNLEFFYKVELDDLYQHNFYVNSKGKVYITKIDVDSLNIQRINSIGLYFGTIHDGDRFRPSFEGSRIIKPNRNLIELDEKALKTYITGENLFKSEVISINWEDNCPFQIIKYQDEFLGAVSIKEDYIINYISKGRKLDYNRIF